VFRRTLRPSHRFAELNVKRTREYLTREGASFKAALRFEHEPLAATEAHPTDDPFHSEIFGTPPNGDPNANAIAELIAECVELLYEAVVKPARSGG
jgi:hypothetical protein